MTTILPIDDSVMITEFLENPSHFLTPDEWLEMQNLKDEINYNPANVVPHKMERFTELYVRSLEGKGENTHVVHAYNKN